MSSLLTRMFADLPRKPAIENEFTFPMLFRDVDNRQHSTLSYETTFFPSHLMKEKHRIAWKRTRLYSKEELMSACNDNLTELSLEDSPASFPIYWMFNAIPTRTEWDKLNSSTIFRVDFRISPLIPRGGRAAIVSIHLGNFHN